jgi:hypothetical protein
VQVLWRGASKDIPSGTVGEVVTTATGGVQVQFHTVRSDTSCWLQPR